jgi:hypothetical protein
MTEIEQPSTLPWVRFREDVLTAREECHKAAINAVRRFVDVHPIISRRPRLKAIVEARLQLREDLISARFQLRRAVVHSVGQLITSA